MYDIRMVHVYAFHVLATAFSDGLKKAMPFNLL